MSQPFCVLCAFYHPRAEPHLPDMTSIGRQTCPAGMRRLEHELLSVRAAFLRLAEEAASPDLPSAAAGQNRGPSVSGSRERRLPIDVTRVDLLAPATPDYVRDHLGDQVGRISVADVLNEWVAAWHDRFCHSERYPRTDAVSLIDWIAGVRLVVVAGQDPAIADFAAELRGIRSALRHALGEVEPARVVMWGVTCPRDSCQMVSQLSVDPDDPDGKRECGNCGLLLTRGEYLDHVRSVVDEYRSGQDLARG